MSAAIMVTILVTAGVYLILQKGLVRAAFGFVLIGHAANVLILAAGGMDRRQVAYVGEGAPDPEAVTDPLLQAFALTAIVITFALTVYMFAMAGHGGDDDAPASGTEPLSQEELHLAAGVSGFSHEVRMVTDSETLQSEASTTPQPPQSTSQEGTS